MVAKEGARGKAKAKRSSCQDKARPCAHMAAMEHVASNAVGQNDFSLPAPAQPSLDLYFMLCLFDLELPGVAWGQVCLRVVPISTLVLGNVMNFSGKVCVLLSRCCCFCVAVFCVCLVFLFSLASAGCVVPVSAY